MECYSHYKTNSQRCAECDYRDYCRTAGDPPLSGHVNFDSVSNIEEAFLPDESTSSNRFPDGHWMALCRRCLEIDDKRVRTILLMKIENPNVSLSEIGRRFGITKQAVDKEITFACRQMPELAVVLRNRPMYNRWRPERTNSPANHSRVQRLRRNSFVQLEITFPVDVSRKCK